MIDESVGNILWKEGAEKEVAALIHHQYFAFKSPNFKPPKEYQYYRLHMVYDMKPDLTHKTRLVCDGFRVNSRGLLTSATVVKGVSVRLFHLIADSQNPKFLQGDIGNAFIQAHAKDNFVTKCGPAFGDIAGAIDII